MEQTFNLPPVENIVLKLVNTNSKELDIKMTFDKTGKIGYLTIEKNK